MLDISKLKEGQKVHYKTNYKIENGIIKEIPDFTLTQVRVVYNCGGDWENYTQYTSCLTNISDLYLGWIN